jgi:hypothetical protein
MTEEVYEVLVERWWIINVRASSPEEAEELLREADSEMWKWWTEDWSEISIKVQGRTTAAADFPSKP